MTRFTNCLFETSQNRARNVTFWSKRDILVRQSPSVSSLLRYAARTRPDRPSLGTDAPRLKNQSQSWRTHFRQDILESNKKNRYRACSERCKTHYFRPRLRENIKEITKKRAQKTMQNHPFLQDMLENNKDIITNRAQKTSPNLYRPLLFTTPARKQNGYHHKPC